MKYEELLKLDRLAGSLPVAGMHKIKRITRSLSRRLKGKRFKPHKPVKLPDKPKRILIIKLWGLGNMVQAGRALKSIRTAYNCATITLLTTPECVPIYDGNRLYNEVIKWDIAATGSLAVGIGKLSSTLQQRKFDLVINLEGLSELAAYIAMSCGVKATVGMVKEGKNKSDYALSASYQADAHVEDLLYRIALIAGGAEVSYGLVRPTLREQERGYCQEILNRCEIDQHTLLIGFGICTGDFAPERRWPLEKFALLAQMIESQAEFKTVFFGNKAEERYIARAISLMETPGLNLGGAFSLRQTMAFLERTHLLITNDSGLLHLAAALGVPSVTVFGPENPVRVGRRDAEEHAAIYNSLSCSPCVSMFAMQRKNCLDGTRCISDISVDDVRVVVMDMLDHLADPVEPPWLQ